MPSVVPHPLPDVPIDLPKARYGVLSKVVSILIICICISGELQFTLYIPIVDTLNYFPVSYFLSDGVTFVIIGTG